MIRSAKFLLVLFVATAAAADTYKDCTSSSAKDEICTLQVEVLKPTQFAVGVRDVAAKRKKLAKWDETKRLEKSLANPIEVVISHAGDFYVTDGHHRSVALYLSKKDGTVAKDAKIYAKVLATFEGKPEEEFWKEMDAKYFYLINEKNVEDKRENLPRNLEELSRNDDPYRSLAADVNDAGGFPKDKRQPYLECKWGRYFRSVEEIRNLIETGQEMPYQQAVVKATALAKELGQGKVGFVPEIKN